MTEKNQTPSENFSRTIRLSRFIEDFHEGLLGAVRKQNPPVYTGIDDINRTEILNSLKRKPFPAQAKIIQAVTKLLIDEDERAAVVNGEMGTGKVRRVGAK